MRWLAYAAAAVLGGWLARRLFGARVFDRGFRRGLAARPAPACGARDPIGWCGPCVMTGPHVKHRDAAGFTWAEPFGRPS